VDGGVLADRFLERRRLAPKELVFAARGTVMEETLAVDVLRYIAPVF
jgi:hypothetical protein